MIQNQSFYFRLTFVVTLFLLSPALVSNASAENNAFDVDFKTQVQPIFESYCVKCHGEEDPKSFRIDVAEEAMDYIEAGEAEESSIYLVMISDDEDEVMPPPDEAHVVSKELSDIVAKWINEGAKWPEDVTLADNFKKEVKISLGEAVSQEDEATGNEDGTKKDEPRHFVPSDLGTRPDGDAEEKKDKKDDEIVYRAIGSLHPAVLHLPIGLILASAFFALLGIRGNFVMSDCAYYCLWLGMFGCIAACVTGWWFSPMENVGTVEKFADLWDDKHKVFWHRTAGLIVTIVALLLCLIAAGARNRDPDDGVFWKLGVMVLALGIGWTGHKGGELTHGKRHYDDLKKLLNSVIPMEEKVEPKKGEEQPAQDAIEEDVDATGKVIEEESRGIDLNNDGKDDLGLGRDT